MFNMASLEGEKILRRKKTFLLVELSEIDNKNNERIKMTEKKLSMPKIIINLLFHLIDCIFSHHYHIGNLICLIYVS